MAPDESGRASDQYSPVVQMMMRGNELGEIKEGYLADLLLVDGDPLSNISILQNPAKLLAIMKDGQFCKEPEIRSARTRWTQTAA